MSHKRVVTKRGKTYGPYLYESYRDKDGKVKKRYLGKAKQNVEQKKTNKFLLGFVLLSLVFVLLLFLRFPLAGKVVLSLDEVQQSGELLSGEIRFVLQQSELIPSGTTIKISTPTQDYSYSLSDLITQEETEGDFYLQDSSLSGYGSGYSAPGERFPLVSFVLGIYQEAIEPVENETVEEPVENETVPAEEPIEESGTRTVATGNAVASFFAKMVGYSVLDLVEEIEGEVRANETYIYDLEENQTAEIISSFKDVELVIEGLEARVTTDYLGGNEDILIISVDDLNITAEEGALDVLFEYEGEAFLLGSTEISISDGTRETPIEQPPIVDVIPEGPSESSDAEELPLEDNETSNETRGIAANCGGVVDCNCGDILTSSWNMSSNLSCTSGTALSISAHNVVLDCKGYTLGDGACNPAVDLGTYDNVTIKNCYMHCTATNNNGITYSSRSPNNLYIFNNTIDGAYRSIRPGGGNNHTLEGNTLVNLQSNAHIPFSGADNVRFIDNSIYCGGTTSTSGVHLAGDNISILNNYFEDCTNAAISSNNAISNTTVAHNVIVVDGGDSDFSYGMSFSSEEASILLAIYNNTITLTGSDSSADHAISFNNFNNSRVYSNIVNNFNSSLDYPLYLSQSNKIHVYNNKFNSTRGPYYSGGINNTFNTTFDCTRGPNILGGRCLGGNYWYTATSVTDADDDGIGDSSYSYSGITDYVPLNDSTGKLCGYNLTHNYTLIDDFNCGGEMHMLGIGGDNFTFDCQGNFMIGNLSHPSSYSALYGEGSREGVTVKNCNFLNQRGYVVYSGPGESSNWTIYNNTVVKGNIIFISGGKAYYWNISNNIIGYSSQAKIYFGNGGDYNLVENNVLSDMNVSSYAIAFNNNSLYNRVINNTVTNCTSSCTGIYFAHNSQYNLIENNSISSYYSPIRAYSSPGHINSYTNITGNNLTNVTRYGIYFVNVNETLVYNNYIENSSDQDAYESGGLNNYWNTSYDCSRTNIIGGACVGGNFWGNYTGTDSDGDGIGDTSVPYTSYGNIAGGDYLPLTNELAPATYDNFDGDTTDFNNEPNPGNISDATIENSTLGKILWSESINSIGQDFDTNVVIGSEFISVNSSALGASINSSANLTFYNIDCDGDSVIYYRDGHYTDVNDIRLSGGNCVANGICSNVQCIGGENLTFTTSHFSGFAIGINSNLTIWDETEDDGSPFSGKVKDVGETVKFFANYTNSTGSIEGATCIINFTDSSNNAMSWNSTGFYEYNRTFSSAGIYDYNVSCSKAGYDDLIANDTVNIIFVLDSCGETVTSNPLLTSDLDCSSSGAHSVNIGAENITIDCQGYAILTDSSMRGINNLGGYDNMTIKNCNLTGEGPSSGSYGIYVNGVDGVRIINNTIAENNYGFTSSGTAYSVLIIENNTFTNHQNGVMNTYGSHARIKGNNISGYLGTSGAINSGNDKPNQTYEENILGNYSNNGAGIQINYNGSIVRNNIFYIDSGDSSLSIGIRLRYKFASGNTPSEVYNNTIIALGAQDSSTDIGIDVNDNLNNLIYSNNITGFHSNDYGIYVRTNSGNNTIYNNYLNNSRNVIDLNDSNYWNISQQSGPNIIGGNDLGGNYYSDYTGYDTNGDGIGEIIYSSNGATDYLPLTNTVNAAPVIQSLFVNSSSGFNLSGENLTCWTNTTDGNGDNLNYSGYWYKEGQLFLESNWILTDAGAQNGDDTIYEIGVDSSGDVYAVGSYLDGSDLDWLIVKYYSNGSQAWNATLDEGYGDDIAYGMDISGSSLYVVGTVYNFSGNDDHDIYFREYSTSTGSSSTSQNYNGLANSDDFGYDIVIGSAWTFVVGSTYNVSSGTQDAVALAYNGASLQDTQQYPFSGGGNGAFYGAALHPDSGYTIVMTGSEGGTRTVKHTFGGGDHWSVSSGVGLDETYDVAVDSSGDVYLAGHTTGANEDFKVVKVSNATGGNIWTSDGFGDWSNAYAISLDSDGNVFASGQGTSGSDYHPLIVKYNSTGGKVWEEIYNSGLGKYLFLSGGVAVDSNGNVFFGRGYNYTGDTNWLLASYEDGFSLTSQTQGALTNLDDLESGVTSIGDNFSCELTAYDGYVYTSQFSDNVTVGDCSCSGCLECTAKLDNPSCSEVNLTQNIAITDAHCINDPDLDNKVFNCNGFNITRTSGAFLRGIYIEGGNNFTIQGCNIYNFWEGVVLSTSDNFDLRNFDIDSQGGGYGMRLSSSDHGSIENATLYSTGFPLYISASTNLSILDSVLSLGTSDSLTLNGVTDSRITNNTVDSGSSLGIFFTGGSEDNNLTNNTLENNFAGIYLLNSYNNTFIRNLVSNNTNYGIALNNSNDNVVYDNFFNNTINVEDNNTNYWNNSYTCTGTNIIGGDCLGGNFWSDYLGYDGDEDGIGDNLIPYTGTASINNGGDYLPLTNNPNTAPVIVEVFVNSSFGTNLTTENLTCSANATDDNGDSINYTGYWYKNGVQNLSISALGDYASGQIINVSVLDSSYTTKGDVWFCNLSASDGYNSSVYNASQSLTILNSVPVVSSVVVEPDPANETSDLTCYYNASDDNAGDSLTIVYDWYNEGASQGIDNQILSSGNTTPEQNWSCSVNASDGTDSDIAFSSNVSIQDSTAPIFSNALNVSDDFKRYENVTANITITNFALDTYVFFNNASGSWVNKTVTLSGQAQHNATEEFNITLTQGNVICWRYWANDTAGNSASSSNYCFTVNNTYPVIISSMINSSTVNNLTTDNLTCYVNATDIDETNLSYSGEWYRDGNLFVEEVLNISTPVFGTGEGVAVDSSGNIFVTGEDSYDGYYTFKYDSNGTYLWNNTWLSPNDAAPFGGLVVDSFGDVYVTGYANDVSGSGNDDYYTFKYNGSTGVEIWNASFDAGAGDYANAIAVDNENNVYVLGDADNVTGTGLDDAHLIKYNGTDGSEILNVTFDRGDREKGFAVDVDSLNNIYIAGFARVGAVNDFFVAKYDSSGNHVWNDTFDYASTSDTAEGIAVDILGNVYVTGYAGVDYYTAKYSAEGTALWNVTYDGGSTDRAYEIDVDNSGNSYVAGYSNIGGSNDFLTIKYDSNGNYVWNITYDNGGSETSEHVVLDDLENIYVIGSDSSGFRTIKYKDGFSSGNNIQGQGIIAGTLESQYTSKGDNWTCQVRAYDSLDYSAYLLSSNLTILNTPPVLHSVVIVPDPANTTNDLNCTYSVSDNDSDLLALIFDWYLEGVSQGINNPVLSSGNTTPEQNWSCSVNASDGEDSDFLISSNVTILDNEVPVFSSALNVSNNFRRYENATANITIDNHALSSYVFSTNATGSWVNKTVTLSGQAQHNATEEFNITLSQGNVICWRYWTNDTAGNSATSSTYCFTVQNTKPEFIHLFTDQIVAENSTLEYDLNCSDVDNDTISYSLNDTSIFGIDENTGVVSGTPGFDDAGIYFYNATCNDSQAGSSETFLVNITNTNRVPNVTSITIIPSSPNVTSNLNCTYTANDPDLDSLTPSFNWYLEGASQGIDNQILSSGNLSRSQNWSCTVNVSDGQDSDVKISSNVTILGMVVTDIECEANGGDNWINCSNLVYFDNITRLRTRCGDLGSSAIFNLSNVYDKQDFVYNTTANLTGGYFVLDNSDVEVLDSGNWNLSVGCLETAMPSVGDSEFFLIPFGNLTSAVFVDPTGNYNVTQNETFNITTRVSCTGGECVLTNATLDPVPARKTQKTMEIASNVDTASANVNLEIEERPSIFERILSAITGFFTRDVLTEGTRETQDYKYCTCSDCIECSQMFYNGSNDGITNCTEVVLTNDIIMDYNGTCISAISSLVSNSNLIFDCNGYSIVGGGGGSATGSQYGGVRIRPNYEYSSNTAEVRNCNISNFVYGILIYGVQYTSLPETTRLHKIHQNNISNVHWGIEVSSSANNTDVYNNYFEDINEWGASNDYGVYISYTNAPDKIRVYNNTFNVSSSRDGYDWFGGNNWTGNWWLGYTGCDSTGDGYGNSVFTIDLGGVNTYDYAPLTDNTCICGNGATETGESCDDGNTVDDCVCLADCSSPSCGDGQICGVEECDDGNTNNGDGCSSTCVNETSTYNATQITPAPLIGEPLATNVTDMDDDDCRPVGLPFTFPFFGSPKTTAYLESNGWIGFGGCTNGINRWGVVPGIFFFDVDLRTGFGGGCGDILYDNSTYSDRVIFQWDEVCEYSSPYYKHSGQVIIYENGTIEFRNDNHEKGENYPTEVQGVNDAAGDLSEINLELYGGSSDWSLPGQALGDLFSLEEMQNISSASYEFLTCSVDPTEVTNGDYWYTASDIYSGSVYLDDYDDSGFVYELPWTFEMGGKNFTNVTVETNNVLQLYESDEDDIAGSFTMDWNWPIHDEANSSSPNYAGDNYANYGDYGTYVWVASADFSPEIGNNGTLIVCNESDKVIFTWNGTTYEDYGNLSRYSEHQIVLYDDGNIKWNFKNHTYSGTYGDNFTGISIYNESAGSYFELGLPEDLVSPSSEFSYSYGSVASADSLLGNSTDVDSSGLDDELNVTINGTWNDNPSGIQTVEFYDGDEKLLEFDFDFDSNQLDMDNITITKLTSGGVYATGLEGITKTFYVLSSHQGVCVKNTAGQIASAIHCNGTHEYLFTNEDCNGSSQTVNGDAIGCSLTGGFYVVSGFTHSGAEAVEKGGAIPMYSGDPFFTMDQNPVYPVNQSCLESMHSGETCEQTWEVNATGNGSTTWKFYTTYEGLVSSDVTNIINVTITADQNYAPNQSTPILNSTLGNNYTSEDLAVYNQSTFDLENASVKNIINWHLFNRTYMVLNMPFEGGSSGAFTRDYAYGNNGSVTNATWNETAGFDGKGAYEFLGNSADNTFIQISDSNNLDTYKNLTISAWIKSQLVPSGGGGHHGIVSKFSTSSRSYSLYQRDDGKIYLKISSDGSVGALTYSSGSVTVIPTDVWTHVAITFANGTLKTYINGNLDRTETMARRWMVMNTVPVTIGMDYTGYNYFNGTIDEVLIFNSTLSPEQISTIYNNQSNLLVSNETSVDDTWYATVTPNDGSQDGITGISNNVTIVQGPVCGDGVVEGGEECDDNNTVSGDGCSSICVTETTSGGGGGGGGGGGDDEPECTPDCDGKECGSDGCGGDCGTCSGSETCESGLCVEPCVEDWDCDDWGECSDNSQARNCTDLNGCGTIDNRPDLTQYCEVICEENWECSWTTCSVGDEYSYAYDCVDLNNCGTESEKPAQISCEEVPEEEEVVDETGEPISDGAEGAGGAAGGCRALWSCGDWGICESGYSLEDLLDKDVEVSGVQMRDCTDTTGCAADRLEKRPCSVAIPVEAATVDWCNDTYVEIYEKDTNKLVSRVREEKAEEEMQIKDIGKLNINFVTTEFTGYCDYCYNGIMDFDETEVDCGGPSCPECIVEKEYFDWLPWLSILLWASIVVGSGTIIWVQREEILGFYRELGRQQLPPGFRGLRTKFAKRKKLVRISKKSGILAKGKDKGFMKRLIEGITPKKHTFVGTEKTFSGIRKTRPEMRELGVGHMAKSYSSQQESKKQFSLARKLRNMFKKQPKVEEPLVKEKVTKIVRKKFGDGKASQAVRDTRNKIRGDI